MAVTRKYNVLKMSDQGDSVTGKFLIRKITFYCGQQDHKCTLADADGFEFFSAVGLRLTTANFDFEPPIAVEGITATYLESTIPDVFIYLA